MAVPIATTVSFQELSSVTALLVNDKCRVAASRPEPVAGNHEARFGGSARHGKAVLYVQYGRGMLSEERGSRHGVLLTIVS